MAGARAAIRYAKAVLSLATDQKATDSVNKDMKQIVKTIAESDDLREMLQNPLVRSSVKESVLNQVFKNTNSITGSLVNILITNKRIALLENVASKYNQTPSPVISPVLRICVNAEDLPSKCARIAA